MILSERDIIIYLDDLLFRLRNSKTMIQYDAIKFNYIVKEVLLTDKAVNTDIMLKLSDVLTDPLFSTNVQYNAKNIRLSDKLVDFCMANINSILKIHELDPSDVYLLNGNMNDSNLRATEVMQLRLKNLSLVSTIYTAALIHGVSFKREEVVKDIRYLLLNFEMLKEYRESHNTPNNEYLNHILNGKVSDVARVIIESNPQLAFNSNMPIDTFLEKYYNIPIFSLIKHDNTNANLGYLKRDFSDELLYIITQEDREAISFIDKAICELSINTSRFKAIYYYITRLTSQRIIDDINNVLSKYGKIFKPATVEYSENEIYMEDDNRLYHYISGIIIGIDDYYTHGDFILFNSAVKEFLLGCPSAIDKPNIVLHLISDLNSIVTSKLYISDKSGFEKIEAATKVILDDDDMKEYNKPIEDYMAESEYPVEESLMYIPNLSAVLEAYDKKSAAINKVQRKAYGAYKTFQNQASKIGSQLDKFGKIIKNMIFGDKRAEVIEGKKYTPMGILKAILGSVALFSVSKVAFIIALVVRFTLGKKMTENERKKVIMELEAELEIIEEKVEDAKNDNNRKAKYALMRTKTELQNAIRKIKFGMGAATKNTVDTAKSFAAGGDNSSQK